MYNPEVAPGRCDPLKHIGIGGRTLNPNDHKTPLCKPLHSGVARSQICQTTSERFALALRMSKLYERELLLFRGNLLSV